MQIGRFIKTEELKEELEEMEGYEERKWNLLKKSMKDLWGDYYPTIKHTIQDLRDLAEEHTKGGGIKDHQEFNIKFFNYC